MGFIVSYHKIVDVMIISLYICLILIFLLMFSPKSNFRVLKVLCNMI